MSLGIVVRFSLANQVLKLNNSLPLKPAVKCLIQLTNTKITRSTRKGFVVVEDKDANVNLLGSRAAQQMNLIQDNDENMLSRASEVHVVQTPSEFALTEEQIWTKFADFF